MRASPRCPHSLKPIEVARYQRSALSRRGRSTVLPELQALLRETCVILCGARVALTLPRSYTAHCAGGGTKKRTAENNNFHHPNPEGSRDMEGSSARVTTRTEEHCLIDYEITVAARERATVAG
jgi:hypothetical protein